jgi:hypothetical protein
MVTEDREQDVIAQVLQEQKTGVHVSRDQIGHSDACGSQQCPHMQELGIFLAGRRVNGNKVLGYFCTGCWQADPIIFSRAGVTSNQCALGYLAL